jgi:PEGA domain-containing protein
MKPVRTHRHARASCLLAACLFSSLSQARDVAPAAPPQTSDEAGHSAPSSDAARALARAGAAPAGEPTPQPADPVSSSALDLAERAKQLYALGAEAFAARQNAEAIGYFRRAAALVPSSKLTYNIALAYSEMGDAGRALGQYRAYLRQEGSRASADVLRRIRELESKLAANGVQQLSVSSRPAGATVRVGGEAVGVTPWAGELTPGVYQISLDLPGHEPSRHTVTLAADESGELDVELSPQPRQNAPEPGHLKSITPLTWSFLGVGVGAISGGVAFELSRAASSERAGRASSAVAAAEARGAADAKQMSSILLLGFGGGFLIGGGVLLLLDLSGNENTNAHDAAPHVEAQLGMPCTPDFCGVLTQGRF